MKRLPAEWEPQSAVMLTWPRADGDFADHYPAVSGCFSEIARAISRFQPLIISFHTRDQQAAVMATLEPQCPAGRLRSYCVPNDDVWARDHGPIGIRVGGRRELLKFGFDGWGGKFDSARDNLLALELARQGAFEMPREQPIVLEGGAIDSDGQGSLLATRRSVLDVARNPGWNGARIESLLRQELGVERFLWLDHGGLAGDDTDGHIDTLARFVSPEAIAYQASGGPDDPNGVELDAMRDELRDLRRADDQPYELYPLPCAGLHHNEDGDPLPAGYANFLIINGAVLVPTYAVDADAQALSILTGLFPEREVLGIDCRALIRQYGSLHCVTMNLPA